MPHQLQVQSTSCIFEGTCPIELYHSQYPGGLKDVKGSKVVALPRGGRKDPRGTPTPPEECEKK